MVRRGCGWKKFPVDRWFVHSLYNDWWGFNHPRLSSKHSLLEIEFRRLYAFCHGRIGLNDVKLGHGGIWEGRQWSWKRQESLLSPLPKKQIYVIIYNIYIYFFLHFIIFYHSKLEVSHGHQCFGGLPLRWASIAICCFGNWVQRPKLSIGKVFPCIPSPRNSQAENLFLVLDLFGGQVLLFWKY